jgi:hypothetical protein
MSYVSRTADQQLPDSVFMPVISRAEHNRKHDNPRTAQNSAANTFSKHPADDPLTLCAGMS